MRQRRTQAERSATTRAAVLAATTEALVERGYAGTTTTDVARRAGVSAGALLHHFPTKAELLAAAVEHLFDQRIAEFRKAMADLPPEARRVDGALDVLWRMFSGPTFTAWLELWTAARTDRELAPVVVEMDRRFDEASREAFREIFAAEVAAAPDLPRLAVGLSYAFLSGLALARQVPGYDPAPAEELLSLFTLLVTPALPDDPERTTEAT